MKAYKGMDRNMQCRGFRYKVGETYTTDKAVVCETGFHACEYPLDVFQYYVPSDSRFFEVEQSGEISNGAGDSKACSSEIKIVAEIAIPELIKASIEYTREKANDANSSTGDCSANSSTGCGSANSSTGRLSANSATGNRSANSATGYRSANSSTGHWSANSAAGYGSANSSTGDFSANSATGCCSANSATGIRSANSATGDFSANSSTGNRSANSSTGDCSANSSTGHWSANSSTGYGSANITTGTNSTNEGGAASVNVGWGKDNRCRGVVDSYLVLSLWGDWDGEKYPLITAKMFLVDGENVKADTWYTLNDSGELVEVVE